MGRPLVSVVSAYIVGLLLAGFLKPVSPAILIGAGFALLLFALIFGKLRSFLLWPLLTLLAWANYAVQTQIISPYDLRILLSPNPQIVSVRGKLMATPTERIYTNDGLEIKRTLAQVEVTALKGENDWQPAVGKIMVTTPDTLPKNYFKGQPIEINSVIMPPSLPIAPGLFNYREYLKHQGIYFQLKTDSYTDWQLLSTNSEPPISDRFRNWARATLSHGLPTIDEPVKLLWAMTLGWKTALTGDASTPFRESGTMHIFAISGLHIALIAGILLAILRTTQLPRFACGVVIIPLLWFYTMATGWQPSAVRSTIMMTIVIGGWMLKRPANLLNSLAAAALIILLWDPQQLFQASFQLSFFVVLSIALFMPPLEKLRDRLLQTDPLLPRELLPIWKQCFHFIFRHGLTLFAVSLAAWLGSWPLCAYYFHLFSPITLLANMCIVPVASMALASNLGSLICGAWLPWATILFNHSAWFSMNVMVHISHGLAGWPHAFLYVNGPTLMDFIIYYAALFAVLSGVIFKRVWRIPMLFCLVLIAGFYGWRWHVARQTITLTVLPLNGGSAVFIHGGNPADNLLVDCGSSNSVEFVTAPFLHAHGINHLPTMALTQGDLQDMGGALEICDGFSVSHVFTSAVSFRSHIYRKTLTVLDQVPQRHQIINQGDSIGIWQVLYPAATNRFPQADDNSLVLKSEIYGLKVLLLSDLGRDGQEVLLNTTNDLSADIVVAGLPRKTEPLSDAMLKRIQPKFIIVADSEFPATQRASAELSARLEHQKARVIYTRKSGAITIVTQPNEWNLSTMAGQQWQFFRPN